MKLAYFPGCSLEASSEAYDLSTRAICDALGIQLYEIDDWNCCGATEAPTLNRVASIALVARNLARVPDDLDDVVAPCAACYLNLRKTNDVLSEDAVMHDKVNQALQAGGLSIEAGRLQIRHLLDVLVSDIGKEQIQSRIKRPLTGLRVAPYYGCQIVRPRGDVDDPEQPYKLDELLRWLGATVVDYPLKSHCCGGHMTQISEKMSNELIRRLLHNAADYDAHVIACLCPMCQLNLDAYQGRVNSAFNTHFELPALFVTQLVGLAFDLDVGKLGFGKEIVKAEPVINKAYRVAAEAEQADKQKAAASRSKSNELPMPRRK